MGVAGSGKTTVGRHLAEQLGWPFHDGDDFHPPVNVAKMRAGTPLTDADRNGWLATLRRLIDRLHEDNHSAVIACSGLKAIYRQQLGPVCLVYLKINPALAHGRLRQRPAHFFKEDLVASQFAILEEPTDAVVVDGSQDVATTVALIRRVLAI